MNRCDGRCEEALSPLLFLLLAVILDLLFFQLLRYSWPSVSMGSTSRDSTNHGMKIFEKIPGISQKQNLNLLPTGNHSRSPSTVFRVVS